MDTRPSTAVPVPNIGGGFGALGQQRIDAGKGRRPVRPEVPGGDLGTQTLEVQHGHRRDGTP